MVGALSIIGGLVGLVVGSFVNVVAYRIPLGKSVVRPGSACPACGAPIRSRDNVPVLSWLLLGGHCRDCGAAISVRYAIVEAATAGLFAATVLAVGAVWVLPAYWWFVGVCIALVLTDLDHKRIPNRILFPGIVVGTALLALGAVVDAVGGEGTGDDLLRALAGGLAYFGILFAIAAVARGGFGFGDVKLAFLLGVFLAFQGWEVLWAGILLAFLIGGVVAIALLATRRKGRKDAIPFGPSLVAGAFIALFWGSEIASWYLGT